MWGTEEQKQHYLPRILSRDDIWCQGYSEPNAGSDLGNLGCRAVLDGDQWVINGQKIWTSAGHLADHIFLLTRTDPDAPKHKGISFLLVDMRQPGVEVRPIKMITGESEFNEVFFTDAVCPKENVRRRREQRLGRGHDAARLRARRGGRHRAHAVPERDEAAPGAWPRSGASTTTRSSASGWRGATARSRSCAGTACARSPSSSPATTPAPTPPSPSCTGASTTAGSPSWPWTSWAPTAWCPPAAVRRRRSQADDEGAPNSSASWSDTFLNARAGTIYAGTSQVQRNILGEMVLGLPKEPKADGGDLGRVVEGQGLGAEAVGAAVTRAAVAAVAVRPSLWLTAAAGRRPPGAPGLVAPATVPAPARPGLRRLPGRRPSTATPDHPLVADDVVQYLALVPVAAESDMRRRRTRDRGRASKRGPAPVRVDR